MKFIVYQNKVRQIYSENKSTFVVYDRNSVNGLTEINKELCKYIYDDTSFSFRTDCVDFLKFISVKLKKVTNESIDTVPLDVAIYDTITQSLFENDIIDTEDFDECYTRACCDATIKFLGKTITNERYTIVKLYIIEQILQKHYCHIYNETWLLNKQQNSNLDLNTEPQIAVFS